MAGRETGLRIHAPVFELVFHFPDDDETHTAMIDSLEFTHVLRDSRGATGSATTTVACQ